MLCEHRHKYLSLNSEILLFSSACVRKWIWDADSYRSVILISGMIMEQVILTLMIVWHVWGNHQLIRPSQHCFMEDRSCLANLISFCDQMTCLMDKVKAVEVVYL